MLKRVLLSTVLIGGPGAAFAADLPNRATPAPYVAAAPLFTWTGFYLGLNAGAGWNHNGETITTIGLTAPNDRIYTGSRSNGAEFTGGVQAGYNWQMGAFVVGVEGDLNYFDRKTGGDGLFPVPANLTTGFDDRTDFRVTRGDPNNWFGTLRGRLGWSFDRALIYATGGLAFGGKTGGAGVIQRDYYEINQGVFAVTDIRSLPSTSSSRKSVGWTLGGGMEYAVTNAMSVKLEYLHVDLGESTQTFTTLASRGAPPFGPPVGATSPAGNTITIRQDNRFDVVRAGVNVRF